MSTTHPDIPRQIINVSSSLDKCRRIINDTSIPSSIRTRVIQYITEYPIWRNKLNQNYDTYVKQTNGTNINDTQPSSSVYYSGYIPSTDPGLISLVTRAHHTIYLNHITTWIYRTMFVITFAILIQDAQMAQQDHRHRSWAPIFPTLSICLSNVLKLYTMYLYRGIIPPAPPGWFDIFLPSCFVILAPIAFYGYINAIWAGIWVPALAMLSGIGVPYMTTYRAYRALADNNRTSASNTIRIEYHVYRLILMFGATAFLTEQTSPIHIPLAPFFPFLQIITTVIIRWRWNDTIGSEFVDIWDHALVYGTGALAFGYGVGYASHLVPGILMGHLALASSCLFQLRACARQQQEWIAPSAATTTTSNTKKNK